MWAIFYTSNQHKARKARNRLCFRKKRKKSDFFRIQ